MKRNKAFVKFLALLMLMPVINCVESGAQGTDSRSLRRNSKEKLYFGINLIPKMAAINQQGFGDSLKIKSGSSFDFSAEAGYFFSDYLGISAGAGLSSFSAKLSLDSYKAKYGAIDTDVPHENYQMQISGKTITEDQKVGLLSVPVVLNFRYPAGNKINLFASAGASINIPIVKSFKGQGTFTYKGYYSAYPVTIENYPKYFPTDYTSDTTGTLLIKPMVIGIVVSAGASFSLNESISLGLGLYFSKSLGSISEYDPKIKYRLTSQKNDFQSIMGASKSTGLQSVGLKIGVKYFIK